MEALLPSGLQVIRLTNGLVGGCSFLDGPGSNCAEYPSDSRGQPVPELNLRTYVRERNTNRAGVYFFCLEAFESTGG